MVKAYSREIPVQLVVRSNRRAGDALQDLLKDELFRQRLAGQIAFVLQRAVADAVGARAANWRYDIEVATGGEGG